MPRMEGTRLKFSLGKKITVMLVALAVVLSGVAIAASYHVINSMNNSAYMDKADDIAATVALAIDAENAAKLKDDTLAVYNAAQNKVFSENRESPEYEAYVAQFDHLRNTPEYQVLYNQLNRFQAVNDVDCLYLTFVDPNEEAVVYLVDAAVQGACPTGCMDRLDEANRAVIADPTVGFPAFISDTPEYGWLVSSAAPVYDDAGNVVCYAFADVSMDMVKAQQRDYIVALVVVLLLLAIILCIVAILYVRRFIARPLNTLSDAAARYCDPQNKQRSTFVDLDIHTNDEIEDLHKSMVQMEKDLDSYIDNLVETRAKLDDTRLEADMLSDLAHRDALTGIRNKLAYDQEVMKLDSALAQGQTAFGIAIIDLNFLKETNDTYGHDSGNVSLKKVTRIVCDVFAHSPVFRIGGDEFVAVLRNHDYHEIKSLVADFNAIIAQRSEDDSLPPWERVSAAIGYALYDPAIDTGADSVFRRADQHMYEHKKQMKGEAAVRR